MRLTHDSDDGDATCRPYRLPLENRCQLVLVALGECSQDVDDLRHLRQLVLLGDFGLELRQVDLLSTIVSRDEQVDDLRDGLDHHCMRVRGVERLLLSRHFAKGLFSRHIAKGLLSFYFI